MTLNQMYVPHDEAIAEVKAANKSVSEFYNQYGNKSGYVIRQLMHFIGK